MKRLITILMALVMLLSLTTTAFAQDVVIGSSGAGKGSITITNPSKGVEYGVVKLFDATIHRVDNTTYSTVYTGTIPNELNTIFEKDAGNNIKVKDGVSDAQVVSSVQSWAKKQTVSHTVTSDGTPLTFKFLDMGYYAVISGQGQVVTINSNNPDVEVIDKNTTAVEPPVKNVDDDNVKIGDTATYTVTFKTANYNGENKIVSYTIHDDQPDFLSNVQVTGITVGGTAIYVQQFDSDKKIVIPWVDDNNNHLYNNGAEVAITYTAVVTDKAAVDGNGNTNTVTLTWNDEEGEVEVDNPESYKDTATIFTYALALKKVNSAGIELNGAKFQFPFYVKETPDAADGAYIYAGTSAREGLTNTITTPAGGLIIVKGLESGTQVSITETEAPIGYNKLSEAVVVTPVKTGSTTTNTTIYLDENGNITETETETVVTVSSDKIAATAIAVVNKAGTTLPSTGGMGTTLFYVFGGIMMLAAVVLLVTKKRMASAE